jgi:elongation factor Ts
MDLIRQLREKTGAGIMDCKKALAESNDNIENAVDYLRKKGIAKAANKADRVASEGLIDSYIHMNGKIGVLLEINCETDFVARTDDFKALSHDIAMHIAASAPLALTAEDLDPAIVARERDVITEQLKQENKPAEMIEKIAEGKIQKFYKDVCLLDQPFVKDPAMSISSVVTDAIAKLGENIQIKRFARFALGEK